MQNQLSVETIHADLRLANQRLEEHSKLFERILSELTEIRQSISSSEKARAVLDAQLVNDRDAVKRLEERVNELEETLLERVASLEKVVEVLTQENIKQKQSVKTVTWLFGVLNGMVLFVIATVGFLLRFFGK